MPRHSPVSAVWPRFLQSVAIRAQAAPGFPTVRAGFLRHRAQEPSNKNRFERETYERHASRPGSQSHGRACVGPGRRHGAGRGAVFFRGNAGQAAEGRGAAAVRRPPRAGRRRQQLPRHPDGRDRRPEADLDHHAERRQHADRVGQPDGQAHRQADTRPHPRQEAADPALRAVRAAGAGQVRAGAGLQRPDQPRRARPVLRELQGGRPGQEADRHHHGADRRPPHAPDLGRAGLPRPFQAHRRRAGQFQGLLHHPDRQARRPRRRHAAHQLRQHPEDAELPGGAGGRRARAPVRQAGWRRHRHRDDRRQARFGHLRPGGHARPAALLQQLLRHPVPAAQAGPDRDPGRFQRRHGKLGRGRLQRADPAVRPEEKPREGQEVHLQHQCPRAGAPVVRQPGDDGLVGQPVAQRRLRVMDGDQGDPPLPSRMAPLPGRHGRARIRDEPGRAQDHAPDPDPDRDRGAGRRGLRRHHLPEGRGFPAHAGSLPGRIGLPQGHARLHGEAPVFEYDIERPVGRAGKGLRQAGREAGLGLDPAAGLPLDPGRAGLRGGQAQGDAVAGTVPPRRATP